VNNIIVRQREQRQSLSMPELHPVLSRIFSARDVASAKELEKELGQLLRYDQLKNIKSATELLIECLISKGHIIIIGDFDADGATSTALTLSALKLFGFQSVDYLVPNRFEFGYGLTPEIVDVAAKASPELIITVDNGISNFDGVNRAQELGIKVLITDHHLPAETLPNADVIVNPNQPGDTFASKNLAGVGVIFYVMLALRQQLRDRQWFTSNAIAEPNMAQFLDLVALGTVADVVPLDRNNRILVYQGIQRIKSGLVRPGILALIRQGNRQPHSITAADMGFVLGPRLNAAGRLEDMSQGIACLLADDAGQAMTLAAKLNALNLQRREIEKEMKQQAAQSLDKLELADGDLPDILCLYDAHWHQGVIGILASRLKEKYHRPVIIFANGDDHELKGSGRSVAGVHIRDLLSLVDTRNPGLIKKFGGHAMAAGLTLATKDFACFQTQLLAIGKQIISDDLLQGILYTDGELQPQEMTLELAQLLRDSGPWGQGFPEPVFEGRFTVLQQRIVGENHLKLVLGLEDSQREIDAIAFNQAKDFADIDQQQIYAVYRLDVNEFNGNRQAQMIVEHIVVQ